MSHVLFIVSGVPFDFRAPPGTPRVDEIEALGQLISGALDHIAEGLGIEPGITHIVLAEDLMTEVASTDREIALQHGGSTGPPFTVERLGGLVAGKTLAHHDNHLDATVLIASGMIAWDDQAGFATGISLLAHELAHLCIGRARWASGALEGVLFPSTTGTEYARSIARTSSEEYRATVLANIVFGVVVSVSVNGGEARRMTVYDVMGDSYTDRLVGVLDEVVHPGWPDTVLDYRWGRITLGELGKRIIEGTDQVFTILGHAESHAEAGDRPRPIDACAGHRGVEIYLGPAWEQLIGAARAATPVPGTLDEIRALEDEIVSQGEAAILGMWSKLGITVEERGDREWAMWVTDPER